MREVILWVGGLCFQLDLCQIINCIPLLCLFELVRCWEWTELVLVLVFLRINNLSFQVLEIILFVLIQYFFVLEWFLLRQLQYFEQNP